MGNVRLRLPGKKSSMSFPISGFDHFDFAGARVKVACQVGGQERDGQQVDEVITEAAEHDVIQLRWENGIIELLRVDELARRFPGTVRDNAGTIVIPRWHNYANAVRGERGIALDLVEHISVELTEPIAEALLPTAIRTIEEHAMSRPGLYVLEESGALGPRFVESTDGGSSPYLVLIHGTFCNTQTAFKDLFTSPEWRVLCKRYGAGRVLGLEHRTVTVSPVSNALDLVKAFGGSNRGSTATLHLLTHSRGGLVGDLLCRFPIAKNDEREKLLFEQCFAGQRNATLREQIEELDGLLSAQVAPVHVERFLRVAAPAAGTQLAAGKLDRYLSVLLSLVGRLLDGGGGWFGFVKAIAVQVVAMRTRAEVCPGLEAMMPERALVRFLNVAQRRESALAVIAGDVEGGRWQQAVKEFFADLYFGRAENDLVVDTASMFRGVPRMRAFAYCFRGPDADHLSYFKDKQLRDRVVGFLAAGRSEGFYPIDSSAARGASRGLFGLDAVSLKDLKPRPDRGIVFLLPGIMGSRLKVPKRGGSPGLVWIDVFDLATGGLKKLAYLDDEQQRCAQNVHTAGLLEGSYEKLALFLNRTYHVVLFDFDWRLPIQESANRLATRVQRELETNPNVPIHLLGHSMGGLVSRAFIASNADLWKEMVRRGGRLVMLGTPNYGSYSPACVLTRQHKLTGLLAALDFTQDRGELTQVIGGFPGLLEMLPRFDGAAIARRKQAKLPPINSVNLLDLEQWRSASHFVPDRGVLEAANRFRERLDSAAIDPENMVYVAGSATVTLSRVELDHKPPRYFYTRRGDGTVPWDLGLLPGVPTYYVGADHGGLPNHEAAFLGYLELLEKGSTTRLLKSPATGLRDAAAGPAEFLWVDPATDSLPYLPGEDDLVASILGAPSRQQEEPAPTIQVEVVNGDVRGARFPVLVGHYSGDAIVSVEQVLDRNLNGQLSRDHRLGIYPGPMGSATCYCEPDAKTPGAVILGLGAAGTLTRGRLEDAVGEGLLRYAMDRQRSASREEVLELGLSTVLIGTSGTRLTMEDSLTALVSAAQATNTKLRRAELPVAIQFTQIEVLELYRDAAIDAAHIAKRLEARAELAIQVAPQLRMTDKFRRNRPRSPFEGWPQRIEVSGLDREGKAASNAPAVLRYTVVTGLARNDLLDRPLQWSHVEALLGRAPHGDHSSISTLRQYLLPGSMVDDAHHAPDLVLQLDDWTAQVPWELLVQSGEATVVSTSLPGVLRNLAVSDPRSPKPTNSRRALVIGEPADVNPPLPGARAEANLVSQTLEAHGLDVTKLVSATADENFQALFADDYDIVHIAAHGQFDPANCWQSGVVLGSGRFLTAAEFGNLRATPSLVVLNCCHLGQVGLRRPGLWSASVARELIRIGVGAVVVAGWAVSDEGANIFATTLYSRLLEGRSLMHAVREARRDTAARSGGSDVTWGAYQVYGDPGFVLLRSPHVYESRNDAPLGFVCPLELVEHLSDMRHRTSLSSVGGDSTASLIAEVRRIAESLPENWRARGDVNESLGLALGELGDYQTAIEHLIAAIHTTEASFQSVEQLASYGSKLAERLATGQAAGAAQEHFEASLTILKKLAELAPSSERYAVLGSSLRRYAKSLPEGEGRDDYVRRSFEAYDRGARSNPENLYYFLSILAGLKLCQGESVSDEELDLIDKNLRDKIDDWARLAPADVELLRYAKPALESDEPADPAHARRIAEAYQEAFQRIGASPHKKDAVREHIDTLARLSVNQRLRERFEAVAKAMEG